MWDTPDNCHRLFPDEAFADLYQRRGRRSVPPRVVAVVMVLQRLQGLSDREAVERFRFDMRWKYAAGVPLDYPGFVHTVLVAMRARLARSERPNRIFDVVLEVAKQAGLVGRRRVVDSTPLYDAVATMDTVTLIRSALRQLLKVASAEEAGRIRAVLRRDDDYKQAGKPACDWEDAQARAELVDALARDGYAALQALEGQELSEEVAQAAQLLATVLGQDVECGEDGRLRIARRVAADRVISTVDPDSRHGRKTTSRKFDGYKGHVAIDPDSEVITKTVVTPANVGDGEVAEQLVSDVWQAAASTSVGEDEASTPYTHRSAEQAGAPSDSMRDGQAAEPGESTREQATRTAHAPEVAPLADEGPAPSTTGPSTQAGEGPDAPLDSMRDAQVAEPGESTREQATRTAHAPEIAPPADEGPAPSTTGPSTQAGEGPDAPLDSMRDAQVAEPGESTRGHTTQAAHTPEVAPPADEGPTLSANAAATGAGQGPDAPLDSMRDAQVAEPGESTREQATHTAHTPEAAPSADEGPTSSANAAAAQAGQGADSPKVVAPKEPPVEIYGDASYGRAEFIEAIEARGGKAYTKVQQPSCRQGCFAKSAFEVDVDRGVVKCPAGVTVAIRQRADGSGRAFFGPHCATCPLRSQCTRTSRGRTVTIHAHEKTLQRVRAEQSKPEWKEKYRSTRPKVERKFAHMMRRRHGGRRARLRGLQKVEWDFNLLAAAINLQRLAYLGIDVSKHTPQGWAPP